MTSRESLLTFLSINNSFKVAKEESLALGFKNNNYKGD